jgi:hypothetical protein
MGTQQGLRLTKRVAHLSLDTAILQETFQLPERRVGQALGLSTLLGAME